MYIDRLLILILFLPIIGFGQMQIGMDIDGEFANDESGRGTSINADGSIIAVGAPNNNGNGPESGHVRIFQNINGNWVQLGQDIDGEAEADFSGDFGTIALSADGSTIAIGGNGNDDNGANSGHVRIYVYNGIDTWEQLGQDIDGEAEGDKSGVGVSLSDDGTIVAIGADKNDGGGSSRGHVRVFQYDNIGTWTQLGQDIDGVQDFNQFGRSVSLSANGMRLAIGAPRWGLSDRGLVRVYEFDGIDTWNKMGQDIEGENPNDRSGGSVSISRNGNLVAIGAPLNDGNGFNSGHVRVYEWIGSQWLQKGVDIDGEFAGDESGRAISLSEMGNILAIGADVNDDNGNASGHVRIFQFIEGVWVQIGEDINGEMPADLFGRSVSISHDGTTVIGGANWNDGNGNASGHVRVYDLTEILSVRSAGIPQFGIFPNPASDRVEIVLAGPSEAKQLQITNMLGQIVYQGDELQFDVSNFPSGTYMVQFTSDQGTNIKRLLVH